EERPDELVDAPSLVGAERAVVAEGHVRRDRAGPDEMRTELAARLDLVLEVVLDLGDARELLLDVLCGLLVRAMQARRLRLDHVGVRRDRDERRTEAVLPLDLGVYALERREVRVDRAVGLGRL